MHSTIFADCAYAIFAMLMPADIAAFRAAAAMTPLFSFSMIA
jgi:hypothetical protein